MLSQHAQCFGEAFIISVSLIMTTPVKSPTRIRNHDLQIMTVHFMSLRPQQTCPNSKCSISGTQLAGQDHVDCWTSLLNIKLKYALTLTFCCIIVRSRDTCLNIKDSIRWTQVQDQHQTQMFLNMTSLNRTPVSISNGQ